MVLHSDEQNGRKNLGKENLSWLQSQIATPNYWPALSLKDNLHTEVGDPAWLPDVWNVAVLIRTAQACICLVRSVYIIKFLNLNNFSLEGSSTEICNHKNVFKMILFLISIQPNLVEKYYLIFNNDNRTQKVIKNYFDCSFSAWCFYTSDWGSAI